MKTNKERQRDWVTGYIVGIKHFFEHFFQAMTNIYFWAVAIVAYMVGYPDKTQFLIIVLMLFVLDIFTRFIAIARENNGLFKAFLLKKLSSRKFINGFITKLVGYFVILTIANFSVKAEEIALIGTMISTVCYCGLFFYEAISLAENLRDIGFVAANGFLHKFKAEKDKLLGTNEQTNDDI